MNVHQNYQGLGLATQLVSEIKDTAKNLGVQYLIGSFRPNEYGKYKIKCYSQGLIPIDFSDYCEMKRNDSLPIDGWLRSLKRNGMEPLVVDKHAMTVVIDLDEFEQIKKTYKPKVWVQNSLNCWECEEVGEWIIDNDKNKAIYQESNLWGLLSIK